MKPTTVCIVIWTNWSQRKMVAFSSNIIPPPPPNYFSWTGRATVLLSRSQCILAVMLIYIWSIHMWNSSFGWASDQKARCSTVTGSISWYKKQFFSLSQLLVQILWWCSYRPRGSHMHWRLCEMSLHKLKKPNSGIRAIVSHNNTAHIGRVTLALCLL